MTVHNNTKQGLIVIFAFLGVLLVVAVWGAVTSGRNHRAHALNAIGSSLEHCYAEIATNDSRTDSQVGTNRLIGMEEVRAAFYGTNADKPEFPLKFPSFISADQTWISSERVKLKSTNLLCVVGLGGESRYGVDANGECRFISDEEFAKWPHVSAQKTGEAAGKIL